MEFTSSQRKAIVLRAPQLFKLILTLKFCRMLQLSMLYCSKRTKDDIRELLSDRHRVCE